MLVIVKSKEMIMCCFIRKLCKVHSYIKQVYTELSEVLENVWNWKLKQSAYITSCAVYGFKPC